MPKPLYYDDEILAVPAFRSMFWLDGKLDTADNNAGLKRLYAIFLEHLGKDVQFVSQSHATASSRTLKATEKSLAAAGAFFDHTDYEDFDGLRCHGQNLPDQDDPALPHFRVEQDNEFIKLEISFADTIENLSALADQIAEHVPKSTLLCGVQGFGFFLPLSLESVTDLLPQTTARYRTAIEMTLDGPQSGIKLEAAAQHYDDSLEPGIADIGWRTFVGPFYQHRLPSPVELPDTNGATLRSVDGVQIYTAGNAPIWGDVNSQEDIAAYQDIAQALSSIRYPEPVAVRNMFGDGKNDSEIADNTENYLHRFDREEE